LEASARLGASFTERIPWSVQLRDSMNVGMCSSLAQSEGSTRRPTGSAHHLAKAGKTLPRCA
jgi:hypothetical protein